MLNNKRHIPKLPELEKIKKRWSTIDTDIRSPEKNPVGFKFDKNKEFQFGKNKDRYESYSLKRES